MTKRTEYLAGLKAAVSVLCAIFAVFVLYLVI